ncbi:hypothetical protein G6F61_008546 [Rhizopus arrhizus]|nr:hypothetical protein G6F61_008546 [Rhizopus arrhizus]
MITYTNDHKRLEENLLSLQWAALTGNVGLIKFALDHGAPINCTMNGFLPLQLACVNDSNIIAVQYLIDRGANVNLQQYSKKKNEKALGSTALHVACANGCFHIVHLLLENGAQVDLEDKFGSTPLDIAFARKDEEMVRLLQAAPLSDVPASRRSFTVHRPLAVTPDWYGIGVIHMYDDDTYLQALERRTSRRPMAHKTENSLVSSKRKEGSERMGSVDRPRKDHVNKEVRPLESFYRKSLELRPNNLAHFIRKHRLSLDSSREMMDKNRNQRGIFSRWTGYRK